MTIDKYILKVPIISERFCGVSYSDKQSHILAYTVYLPTSGQDDEFLEIISKLSFDISDNICAKSSILIGLDSNQSEKSTRRRTEAMERFREQFSLKTILLGDRPTFHHNNGTSVSQIDHILYFVPDNSNTNTNICVN